MPPQIKLQAIVYIDGYNHYHGINHAHKTQVHQIRSGVPLAVGAIEARRLFWLNLHQMCRGVYSDIEVVEIKYFTSRVSGAAPGDLPAIAALKDATRRRQIAWLDAVSTMDGVKIIVSAR